MPRLTQRHFRAAGYERVHLLTGSSFDAPRMAGLGLRSETMDLIIDDGVHSVEGMRRTLATFWPMVRPGGLCARRGGSNQTREWLPRAFRLLGPSG